MSEDLFHGLSAVDYRYVRNTKASGADSYALLDYGTDIPLALSPEEPAPQN
jgi:hypothetical protein